MTMHPSRKHTLELKQTVSVIAPDCHFFGNSDHEWDAVDPHTPATFLVGASVQAIGYGHNYLENVTPPLEHAPELLADPLLDMIIPVSDDCDFEHTDIRGETVTIGPGTYRNGLTIRGSSHVTMLPVVYIITGGRFRVKESELQGSHTLISLADKQAIIDWKGSEVRLSGRTAGDYAGFVIVGAREDSKHDMEDTVVDLEGVVYLPNGDFDWVNDGSPDISAAWTAWIVYGFTWYGNGELYINFDIDGGDVPYPSELRRVTPRPGTPRLIE